MSEVIEINKLVSLEVSTDRVSATLIIKDPKGLSASLVADAVAAGKVSEVYLLEPVNRNLKELAGKPPTAFPARIDFARGIPPKPGMDSQVEYVIDLRTKPGTVDPETGQMDFRERDIVKQVKEEDIILKLIPPTKGENGFDIFGNPVVGADGVWVTQYVAGEGIGVTEDNGAQIFHALASGVIVMQGKVLAVSDVLTIGGDIDFKSGNVRYKGTVVVKGSVKTGFEVIAKGDVTIEGFVEPDSKVTGSNVVIMKGCYGRVSAERNVQAEFAENAIVRAGKSVGIKTVNRSQLIGAHIGVNKFSASKAVAYEDIAIAEVISPKSNPSALEVQYLPSVLDILNQFKSEYALIRFRIDLNKAYLTNSGVQLTELIESQRIPSDIPADAAKEAHTFLRDLKLASRFKAAIAEMAGRCDGQINVGRADNFTIINLYGKEVQLYNEKQKTTFSYDKERNCICERGDHANH